MLRTLDTLLSLIAPHRCLGCNAYGSLLCTSCSELLPTIQPCCYRCRRLSPDWRTCQRCRRTSPLHSVVTITHYEGVAEQLIHILKFERAYRASDSIGCIMSQQIDGESILVPIPTATSRVRQRGYDQAELIVRAMTRHHTAAKRVVMLRRQGQQRQTGSTRKQRVTQLQDVFTIKSRKSTPPDSVLLVDDVITTGATLEAAARTLRKMGVKRVHAIVFARTE